MGPASAKIKGRRAATQMTAQQVVEGLGKLVHDLHELLESYAPLWYTEDMDVRVTEMLARFTLLKRASRDRIKEDGHPLEPTDLVQGQ